MSQSRTDELIGRLSSRKFLLCIVSLAIFGLGYANGSLSYEDFSKAVLGAVLTFSVSEGVVDAATAYRPKPAGPEQTVNVDASPAPAVAVKAAPRRVRPSRAKPKAGK